MGYDFKLNKTIVIIIIFLLLFGLAIQVSRSNYLLQLDIKNEQSAMQIKNLTSALSIEEKENFQHDKLLLIYDPELAESDKLKKNLTQTLDYIKGNYEVVPVSEIPDELTKYFNIVIAFPELKLISDLSAIINYVSEGGKLFFAVRPYPDDVYLSLYRKLGIFETNSSYQESIGIELTSDILLKGEELKINEEFISNSSLYARLNDQSKVYARSINNVPLLWSTAYSKGTIMVFNGTMLGSQVNRGLLVGALSYLNDDFIYPIMNSKVVYIDDFPAPFPEGNDQQIYEQYKRDVSTFFRDIWWPDMVQVARQTDLKYTGVLIVTYSDEVKGPFNERLVKENLKIYGRELIKMGGEVGVHGYNHQSLTKDQNQVQGLGYKAWKNEEDMYESLKEVNQFFSELFPNYILRTYVPPSNILSMEGKKALLEAIPTITNIGSIYLGDSQKDVEYLQEFEVGVDVIELPRLSSDYQFTEENKWSIANAATLFGAFSHFIHPDDILDSDRSHFRSWAELIEDYSDMMHSVKEKYPWMRSRTASDSASSLKKYSEAEVFISQQSNKINVSINNFAGELDFIIRSDKKITKTTNCNVEKISNDRYLVHALSDQFEIILEEEQ